MGVWSQIDALQKDITAARQSLLSEYQKIKTEVESIGPEIDGKCKKIVGEARKKVAPLFAELESFNGEVNGRCEAMLAKAAGNPQAASLSADIRKTQAGIASGIDGLRTTISGLSDSVEINIATVTKGFQSQTDAVKSRLDAFEKSGLQPLDSLQSTLQTQSNQVRSEVNNRVEEFKGKVQSIREQITQPCGSAF